MEYVKILLDEKPFIGLVPNINQKYDIEIISHRFKKNHKWGFLRAHA